MLRQDLGETRKTLRAPVLRRRAASMRCVLGAFLSFLVSLHFASCFHGVAPIF